MRMLWQLVEGMLLGCLTLLTPKPVMWYIAVGLGVFVGLWLAQYFAL